MSLIGVFSEILTKEGSKVDDEGRAVLRFSQGVTAYLEWGVGIAYRNEIDLWSTSGSFFTDRIFSKPKEYRPKYRVRDLNGNEYIKSEESVEQFVCMFDSFAKMTNGKDGASIERKNILQRAKLMNDIIIFKGVRNEKLEKY